MRYEIRSRYSLCPFVECYLQKSNRWRPPWLNSGPLPAGASSSSQPLKTEFYFQLNCPFPPPVSSQLLWALQHFYCLTENILGNMCGTKVSEVLQQCCRTLHACITIQICRIFYPSNIKININTARLCWMWQQFNCSPRTQFIINTINAACLFITWSFWTMMMRVLSKSTSLQS